MIMQEQNLPWVGDWRATVRGRIHALGCETVSEFLARYPAVPYFKVARELGASVVAAQLEIMQFEEAADSASVRAAAQEMLVRKINQHLKRGWGKGIHREFNTAGVISDWQTFLKVTLNAPHLVALSENVWTRLTEASPPQGWLPKSAADPYIFAAFEKGWPLSGRRKVRRQPYGLLCPKCTAVLSLRNPNAKEIVCHLCGEQIELV